jgi:hypothetical protein
VVADIMPILRRMPTSPGPLLEALVDLWDRLRATVPALPRITPVVSPTTRRKDHGPERWTLDQSGFLSGLVVTADVLHEGADAVLEMVLHDAAHVLNWARDVQDTTMRGVYHNQRFLTAAEEVGLEWPAHRERAQGQGYVRPVLSDSARARYAPDLRRLTEIIPEILPHLEGPTSASAGRVDRLTLKCGCRPARSFRISKTVAAQGPIMCSVCDTEFTSE